MRKRILLIDDDIASVSAARRALTEAGFDPILATNAADAEIALEHDDPQMVLLALGTGGDGGLEICRTIRGEASDPALPILLIGDGTGEVVDTASALAAGGDGYFERPVLWKRVVAKIESYLGVGEPAPQRASAAEVARTAARAEAARGEVDGAGVDSAMDALLADAEPEVPPVAAPDGVAGGGETAGDGDDRWTVDEPGRQDLADELFGDLGDGADEEPTMPAAEPPADAGDLDEIARELAGDDAGAAGAGDAADDEAARAAAAEAARLEAEERTRREAAAKAEARRLLAERARKQAEAKARAKAKQEAEERVRREAEEKARKEAEARARKEAEEKAKREAEERARREAEEKAKREAEEKAKQEAEERARREAEEKARREAEERARREAEEKAKQEAEERARREAEETAKREAEKKARREAEERARREAEEKAKQEAEERARREAEEKARQEAEERARKEAEEKAKQEAEARARREAEEKARREAEERARKEAEEKAKREAEERARREAEEKAKQEAEERARREAEEKAKQEAEARARREAEAAAKAKHEADQRARHEAEQRAAREIEAAAGASDLGDDLFDELQPPPASPPPLAPPAGPRPKPGEADEWSGRSLELNWTDSEPKVTAPRLGAGWADRDTGDLELEAAREENPRTSRLPEAPDLETAPPPPAPEAPTFGGWGVGAGEEARLAPGGEQPAAEAEVDWSDMDLEDTAAETPVTLSPDLLLDTDAPYEPPAGPTRDATGTAPDAAGWPRRDAAWPPADTSPWAGDPEPPPPAPAPRPPPPVPAAPAHRPPPPPPGPIPAPQPTAAPFAERGEIAETDVPHLLAVAFRARATGILEVRDAVGVRRIFVELGRPVGVRTAHADEQLAEVAYRLGRITREQARTLRGRDLTPRQGAVALVESGFLKAAELYETVRAQAEAALYGAFAVEAGQWRWVEEVCEDDDRVAHPEHPFALVTEGIRRKFPLARIHRGLGGPSTVLAPAGGADLSVLGLTARERRLAEQVDGLKTAEELVFLSGLGEEPTFQVLCALEATGMAEVRFRGPMPEGRAADPERQAVERQIDRVRIAEKFQQALEADYFEILGVPPEATSYEIKAAYDRQVREFQPARFGDESYRDLWGNLEEIRRALDDAWDVLRDEGLRADYLEALAQRRAPVG